MTTIGTAVLQIIPSLKGVTDAIEKQIAGKVVEVKVAPKVDQAAAKKAGKDAGDAIATEAKEAVRKGDVGKAVADEVKTSVKKAAPGKEIGKAISEDVKKSVQDAGAGKEIAKTVAADVKKSSPGRDIAKVIFEGLAEGVRQGLPTGVGGGGSLGDNILDNVTDSVKSAAKNSKIGSVLGGELTDGLIDNLSKSLRGGGIGKTITDALNTVGADLSGPVQALAGSLDPLTTALDSFRGGDAAGGLSAVAEAIKGFESAGVPPQVASTLSDLSVAVETMTSGGKANAVKGLADGFLAMAPAVQEMTGVDLSGVTDGVEKISSVAGGVAEAAVALAAVRTAVVALGGSAVIGALSAFLGALAPVLVPLGALAGLIALGKNSQNPLGVKDPNSGLPATQGNSPVANARDGGDVPTTINGLPTAQATRPAGTRESGGVPAPLIIVPPKRAGGGQVFGAGSGTSDSILAWLSDEEFVVNADATRKNLPLLNIINSGKLPGFATGGQVGPDVAAAESLVGTPYSMAKRFDCSGDVARVINAALGGGDGSLMTTANAAQWLATRGFKPGLGGPGTISVGWKNGGPGGGHMAMTLSDGRNAEGGGSHPNFLIGGVAAGASSPQFTDHMYLPVVAAQASGQGTADQPQAPADAAAPAAASGQGSGSGGGGSSNLPSSISGLSGFGLKGLGSGIGKTGSGSDLSLFGNAASSAVAGQVSSALGVFGVGDTPPFLQAASQLLGGIQVGGKGLLDFGGQGRGGGGGGSAHGTRANQAPGPQNVYNIRTATVEDAFLQAQRFQDVRTAAKLDRY